MSAISESKSCPATCMGACYETQQVKDYIGGSNPNIVMASSFLRKCTNCGALAKTQKEKIIAVLVLNGIRTLPASGYEAIISAPTNIRCVLKKVGKSSEAVWEYLCGDKELAWLPECKRPRCRGVAQVSAGDLFKTISKDVGKGFASMKLCSGGHPAMCGPVEAATLRKEFIMRLQTQCHNTPCPEQGKGCTHYHNSKERSQMVERLEEYVQSVIKAQPQKNSWATAAVKADKPDSTTVPKASGSPSVVEAKPAVKSAPTKQEIMSISMDEDAEVIHAKYLASLKLKLNAFGGRRQAIEDEMEAMYARISSYKAELIRMEKETEVINTILGVHTTVPPAAASPTRSIGSSSGGSASSAGGSRSSSPDVSPKAGNGIGGLPPLPTNLPNL